MTKKYRIQHFNIFVMVFSIVLILDQVTKYLIRCYWDLHESKPIIEGIFHLTRVHNTGAAFGVLKNQRYFLLMIALIMLLLVLRYLGRLIGGDMFKALTVGLIVGGALGNFIDRIIFGFVIDIFDFRVFPVFNIADSAITIAVIIYLLHLFFMKEKVDDES